MACKVHLRTTYSASTGPEKSQLYHRRGLSAPDAGRACREGQMYSSDQERLLAGFTRELSRSVGWISFVVVEETI